MVDIVDSATRSRMMSGIRGRNTKPEILIRSLLHRPGLSLPSGRARSAGAPGHRAAALPRRGTRARVLLARPRLPSFQMAANTARVLARQDRPQSQQRRQGSRGIARERLARRGGVGMRVARCQSRYRRRVAAAGRVAEERCAELRGARLKAACSLPGSSESWSRW